MQSISNGADFELRRIISSSVTREPDTKRVDFLDKHFHTVEKVGQDERGDIYEAQISFQYPQITADGSENLRESIDASLGDEQKERE